MSSRHKETEEHMNSHIRAASTGPAQVRAGWGPRIERGSGHKLPTPADNCSQRKDQLLQWSLTGDTNPVLRPNPVFSSTWPMKNELSDIFRNVFFYCFVWEFFLPSRTFTFILQFPILCFCGHCVSCAFCFILVV